VEEEAADTARARVEILVRAPYSEINTPVVEGHGNIADSMSKIPAGNAALNEMTGEHTIGSICGVNECNVMYVRAEGG